MKRKVYILWIALAGLTLTSCNNSDTTEAVNDETNEAVFSYDASTTEVGFTAYKFTNKAGVSGTFNEVNLSGDLSGATALDVLIGAKFSIPTSSVNTKDEGRDAKIANFFFGTIKTDLLSGEVESIDDENNTLTLSITMNGVSHNVTGEYTLDGNNFSFIADINVEDWSAENGIEALNNECYDLHKGEDGVSKLWPDVTISFKTTFAEKE